MKLDIKLAAIKNKIMVLSGKGGVGKSSVAANLAVSLALEGKKVGLLDIDFHGPSLPTMFNLQKIMAPTNGNEISPVEAYGVKLMSVGLLVPEEKSALIWRGPMKIGVLQQLLKDVDWGTLDFLIMDFPPGTGDEPLSACQMVKDAVGGIVVTTPQEVSLSDCRRCISFCNQLELPVLGVIENMSGFVCPDCGKRTDIFSSDGGVKMAEEEGVALLGKIPLDPAFVKACDEGKPYVGQFPDSETGKEYKKIADKIIELSEK
jgi:Mrp family chromosome partitioning ATPase